VEHKYNISWEHDGHTVIDCQSCGFKHIDPILNQNDLKKFYEEEYFKNINPFSYDTTTDEQIEKTRSQIMDNDSYKDIYDKVLALINTTNRAMADIGCGNLLLSYFFKNKGWTEYVIEPSKDAGEYLRRFDLNVINKPIQEVDMVNFQDISFVNLQFVLEHITNPLEILQKAYQLLVPGGIIRVCVPNDFSESQLAYMENCNEKPRWICVPDHINYFSFDSLSHVLSKAGFSEVYRTTDFPVEMLLLGGMDYYNSEDEQKKIWPFITNFEKSYIKTDRKETLQRFYETLAKAGFGRRVYMYAVKPV